MRILRRFFAIGARRGHEESSLSESELM